MRCRSKEIIKKEKCFAFHRKTKQRKRSRHWETLSRIERDIGSATLIDAMNNMKIWQVSGCTMLPSDWNYNETFSPLMFCIISHILIALFTIMRRKVAQKLKWLTKKYLHSLLKEFKILIKRKILIQKNWYLFADPMERNGKPIRDLLCREKVRW